MAGVGVGRWRRFTVPGVGLGIGVGLGVGVGTGVGVGIGVGVGVGTDVGVATGIGVGIAVSSGVDVGIGVEVDDGTLPTPPEKICVLSCSFTVRAKGLNEVTLVALAVKVSRFTSVYNSRQPDPS